MQACTTVARADVAECPAYVLAAVDELVYGDHAVFILIHLLLGTERRTHEKTSNKQPFCWSVFTVTGKYREVNAATRLEENFYVLTGRLLLEDGVCALSHHVVDGLHDV